MDVEKILEKVRKVLEEEIKEEMNPEKAKGYEKERKKKAKQNKNVAISVDYVDYRRTVPKFPVAEVAVIIPGDTVLFPSFVEVEPKTFVDLLKAYNDNLDDLRVTYYLTFGRKKFTKFLEFLMGLRETPPKSDKKGIFNVSFGFYNYIVENHRLVIRTDTLRPVTIHYHAPMLFDLKDIKELYDYVCHKIDMETMTTTVTDLVQIFIDAQEERY